MSKDIEGLGEKAVNKLFRKEEPQELPKVPRSEIPGSKMGRPRTIYREYDTSSQEGLRDNWTRATFIVQEDLLKRFKAHATADGGTIKQAINEALQSYLDSREGEQ